MIFIDNLGENEIYFPKNGINFGENNITLKLKSELTLKEYTFDNLSELSFDYDYYKVRIDLTDIEEGEYIYCITDGVWSSVGLMRIGQIPNETKSYEKTETIKEYKYGE